MNIEQIMQLADQFASDFSTVPAKVTFQNRNALEKALREALAPQHQEPDCGHESCDCRSYCKKEKP